VIYEAIAQTNLDPAEFNLEIAGDTAVISHVSGSAFAFEHVGGTEYNYRVLATVIDGSTRTFVSFNPIRNLVKPIQTWAKEAKLVAETPDLWAEFQRSRELAVEIQSTDIGNTPFTKDERRQIAVELEAIKEQVKEQFDLTSEQIAGIDEWKDEVAEASERTGRKDWRLLAYGTIINLVVTDALPPEVARHILAMFIQVIAHLFLGGGGPTGILT
jgi:hypothetical protein